MKKNNNSWTWWVLLGVYTIIIIFFLWQLYIFPLSYWFILSALCCSNLLFLRKINGDEFVVKSAKTFFKLTLFLCVGAVTFAYQTTPWRKFSREPSTVYMALTESCKIYLEQNNLFDMTEDSYVSLIEAAELAGVKHPFAEIPRKPGDSRVNIDPISINFPIEIIRYSPFEVGVIRNHVFIKFITNKPGPFYVDIQYSPANDNKWIVTQNRVWGGVGVLWKGNLENKNEVE